MVQRVQVLVMCDLHDDERPGSESVSFSLDGAAYDIDVCDEHAAQLRDALAPFVAAARRVGARGARSAGGRRQGGRARAEGAGGEREKSADIRAWAKSQGIAVSERGRIPRSVVREYEAAVG